MDCLAVVVLNLFVSMLDFVIKSNDSMMQNAKLNNNKREYCFFLSHRNGSHRTTGDRRCSESKTIKQSQKKTVSIKLSTLETNFQLTTIVRGIEKLGLHLSQSLSDRSKPIILL